MRYLGFIACWAFYCAGDLASRTCFGRHRWILLGNYFEWPYRLYSWFMGTSIDIQDKYCPDIGPWSKPEAQGMEGI